MVVLLYGKPEIESKCPRDWVPSRGALTGTIQSLLGLGGGLFSHTINVAVEDTDEAASNH